MGSADTPGPGLVNKRLRVMTNPNYFAKRLSKAQCTENRRHVTLAGFRAGPCQKYPTAFCDEARMAVKEEIADRYIGEKCEAMTNLVTTLY